MPIRKRLRTDSSAIYGMTTATRLPSGGGRHSEPRIVARRGCRLLPPPRRERVKYGICRFVGCPEGTTAFNLLDPCFESEKRSLAILFCCTRPILHDFPRAP